MKYFIVQLVIVISSYNYISHRALSKKKFILFLFNGKSCRGCMVFLRPGRRQAGPQTGRTLGRRPSRARPGQAAPRRLKQHGADGPATRTHRTVMGPDSDDRENRLGWRGRDRETGRQYGKSQHWNEGARCDVARSVEVY